ncbi:hypothetical protein JQ597_31735 [Bradyrhizobium sp. AUGA SZCCT0177]|uniref:hypothetical protein n=1 Tax=Bradyrhizobium sp. AUGA SZCCT0177 TaxID=2807665 RepID=UPI001BAC294A|nr:hypothetical protein [Bradyrhizobium sp. AUGA SZCCT0177]MBR1286635.1 hypothetical protein [Bradyrhizobium sp. AUGA SZCCT0177]
MNRQLDEMDEPTAEDIDRYIEMSCDNSYNDAVARRNGRILQRGLVISAARDRNVEAIDRLTANDPELKDLAVRELAHVHGRGREKGEARPRDISAIEKALLGYAIRDLDEIRWVCKKHWQGRWKGSGSIAIEIAAERSHVGVDRLIGFKKNRTRNARP